MALVFLQKTPREKLRFAPAFTLIRRRVLLILIHAKEEMLVENLHVVLLKWRERAVT